MDNDGMIVCSSRDYVDRDFNAAHNLWTCCHDGRDPRAPHGNYPYPHSIGRATGDGKLERPRTEYFIRPLPGTSKQYVAIAGRHHGPLCGVPVLIDTRIPDDNRMAQVKTVVGNHLPGEDCSRDTRADLPCRAPLPNHWYLTPRPLSEDFYVVSDWGSIDLLDRFGNREVLFTWVGIPDSVRLKSRAAKPAQGFVFGYRPLRSRPRPPSLPTQTWQGERANDGEHPRATIAVVNVYEADLAWPDSLRKITHLRVMQLLPHPDWKDLNYYNQIHRMSLGLVHSGRPGLPGGSRPGSQVLVVASAGNRAEPRLQSRQHPR